MSSSKWLIALNVMLVLIALPVYAQPSGAASTDVLGFALGEIVRTGLMGTIAVVEGFVIRHLYKDANEAKAQFQQLALGAMQVLSRNNEVLTRVEKEWHITPPTGGPKA